MFLDPAVTGRGLGVDAVLALAVHLVRDASTTGWTIDPAAATRWRSPATRAAGFRPVGVLRATSATAPRRVARWPADGRARGRDLAAAARRGSAGVTGRVALVTGVSRRAGIGAAIARGGSPRAAPTCCCRAGAARRRPAWGAARGRDRGAGGGAPRDRPRGRADRRRPRRPAAPGRLVAAAHDRFGRLDILVANDAGSVGRAPFASASAEEIDRSSCRRRPRVAAAGAGVAAPATTAARAAASSS